MLIRRFCFGYEIGNMHVYIIIIIIITRYSPMRVYYFVSVLREKKLKYENRFKVVACVQRSRHTVSL
jgi:hypothetical protein